MTYRGHYQDGVIVLHGPLSLPNGTEVRIDVVSPTELTEDDGPSIVEALGPVIGSAVGLPKDAARNVDHYLYGTPKR